MKKIFFAALAAVALTACVADVATEDPTYAIDFGSDTKIGVKSLVKFSVFAFNNETAEKTNTIMNDMLVEKEGNKLPEYYSKGYQNLFEICKRFALTDVLFTGEKPFIILDDPFYNLDDEKIKTSLALIKELSNEYQIIYFVCHESRVI